MLKSRISYGLFLFAAIAFYLFYSKFIAVVILICAIAVPLVLSLPIGIAILKIKIRFADDTVMVQNGDDGEIRLIIDNPTIINLRNVRLWVETKSVYTSEKLKQKYVFSISKKGETNIVFKIKSDHCTKVNVRLKKIRCCDPLGMLSLFKRIKETLTVFIVPKLLPTEQNMGLLNLPDDEGSRYSIYKKGEDYAQTFDYHIYRDGDKIKHINWKLSGKQDELMVREGSLPLSSRACIIIDPNMLKSPSSLDNMLSSAVSLSDGLTVGEIPHDVGFYYEKDGCCRFVNVTDISDFYYAITLLYENSIKALNSNTNVVLNEFCSVASMPSYAKIYYITNVLDEQATDNLLIMHNKSDISIFFTENNDELVEIFEAENIEAVRI